MLFFLLAIYLIYDVSAAISVLDKGIIPLQENSVGIQFFIDVVNEDRIQNCRVLCWAKRCCLNDTEKTDCSIMKIFSGFFFDVKPKARETIINVYPTIIQHDLVGYCDFVLDSKCGRSIRNIRRYVYVPFDTRTSIRMNYYLLKSYVGDRRSTYCDSLDEDSLSECKPVVCDHKYSGARPFYETRQKKCIPATMCVGVDGKEMPDLVYVPKSNICRDLENPLSVKDVYDINTGTYVTTTVPDDVYDLRSNCSTLSENLKLLTDLITGNAVVNKDLNKVDYSQCVKIAILKMFGWIALSTVLLFSCVLMIWVYASDRSHSEAGSHVVGSHWQSLKSCWVSRKMKNASYFSSSESTSRTNEKVKNQLLRQVMVRDVPIELRETMVNICDRMDSEVKSKKRYRRQDLGSQISLRKQQHSETGTSTDSEEDESTEKDKLLK